MGCSAGMRITGEPQCRQPWFWNGIERLSAAESRSGEYLTRVAGLYVIWDPAKHRRVMAAAGGQIAKKDTDKEQGFSLSLRKSIESTRKEHTDALAAGLAFSSLSIPALKVSNSSALLLLGILQLLFNDVRIKPIQMIKAY